MNEQVYPYYCGTITPQKKDLVTRLRNLCSIDPISKEYISCSEDRLPCQISVTHGDVVSYAVDLWDNLRIGRNHNRQGHQNVQHTVLELFLLIVNWVRQHYMVFMMCRLQRMGLDVNIMSHQLKKD